MQVEQMEVCYKHLYFIVHYKSVRNLYSHCLLRETTKLLSELLIGRGGISFAQA